MLNVLSEAGRKRMICLMFKISVLKPVIVLKSTELVALHKPAHLALQKSQGHS